ncbi:MAG: type II secretion system F family protein [Methylocystis sp.]
MTLADFLPDGVNPDDAITMLAGASAFLTVMAVWFGLVAPRTSTRRVRELGARREQLRIGMLAPRRRKRDSGLSTSFMRRVVHKLNLQRNKQTEIIVRKLARAGWRNNDALVRFLFFKAIMPLVAGAAFAFAFYVLKVTDLSPMMRLAATIGATLGGAFAPDIVVKNAIDKRADKIRKGLPDALDLMVICAEAGLSLDALMKRVAEEFGTSCPELADEMSITSLELGFLPDRRQALLNFSARTDSPGTRGLVNSLLQSDKYGTPLAQSLRVLSAEFREERMLRAEEKAARLPALLTVPMIIFILPPLFVVLIGPAVLETMDAMSSMT